MPYKSLRSNLGHGGKLGHDQFSSNKSIKTYCCAVLPFFILHPPYYRIVMLIYIEMSAWSPLKAKLPTQASLK